MMVSSLFLSALLGSALAHPTVDKNDKNGRSCPPISGDFNVTYFRLYPEGFDYDSINCKAYFGGNFNGTALKKDLTTGEETLLTFPGISYDEEYHISGVQFNAREKAMYFSGNNGVAFSSMGTNLTGPNKMIKYDVMKDKIVYIANVDPVVEQIKQITGVQVNGGQDMAQDLAGNSYYLMTYGNAIIRISPSGTPSLYYYTEKPTMTASGFPAGGWNGIASIGNLLVLFDNISKSFYTFDATAKTGTPTIYKPSNTPATYNGCDRIYFPPMYNNKVLLCADDINGTTVYSSGDNWKSAKWLGQIQKKNAGSITTAVAQISNSLYMNAEYFFDLGVFDIQPGGNRSVFPFQDITSAVATLVGGGTC